MNILYISSEYPPETGHGGIGTYTKYIAEGMAQRGHTVSVIARSNNGIESILFRNGVTIYRLPPHPYPLPTYRWAYLLRRIITSLFPHVLIRISWALAIKKKINHLYLRSSRFDVIETPECGAENLFVPKKAARQHITRLHTPWEIIRNFDNIKEPIGDHWFLPILEKLSIRKASSVSSPSRALAAYITEKWRIAHITIIPNPIPAVEFQQSNGTGWIYTGRVERRKGVHHLIAAYHKLSLEIPTLPQLTLIGPAYGIDHSGMTYETVIRRIIDSGKHNDSIVWIAHATHDEVITYLQHSSVAFFPSLWENYPYTCLEAMASGCAVIASNCGGFPEIIESGKNGLLISPDSENALYGIMKYLIGNTHEILRLGTAARKRVDEIASSPMVCTQMEHFYTSTRESTG